VLAPELIAGVPSQLGVAGYRDAVENNGHRARRSLADKTLTHRNWVVPESRRVALVDHFRVPDEVGKELRAEDAADEHEVPRPTGAAPADRRAV
jgi:hypothetical protein